ncbi:hypothetical protein PYCC9005_001179 [Savitreella phatthalungensis]
MAGRGPHSPPVPLWAQLVRIVAFILYFFSIVIVINFNQWLGLPLYLIARSWWYAWIAKTKAQFGVFAVSLCEWFAPTEAVFSGDETCADEIALGQDGLLQNGFDARAVVISNHQIYADWLYIWWAAYTSRMHGALYIVLKDSLKWIPLIGWGMQLYGFVFMARSWEQDRPRLQYRLGKLEAERDLPMWFLLYPEGTNMSNNTRPRAQAYAKKTGAPYFEHVLLPRTTGLRFCLSNLQKTVPYIYDCTMAYEPSPRGAIAAERYTLKSIFIEGKPPKRVHMHWRKIPIAGIPLDDEKAFEKWMYARWQEKEDMLEHYHNQGTFPAAKSVTAPIRMRAKLELASSFTPLALAGLLARIYQQVKDLVT